MDVALINPPTVTAPRSLSYYGAVPPLGLAYVAAATRAAGHTVRVIDGTGEALERLTKRSLSIGRVVVQGLDHESIVARIPSQSRVIGVSIMFLHQWPLCRELFAAIRQRFPGATLVAGGETATAYWDRMLGECPALDCCVLGEGESSFAGLLAALDRDQPLDSVSALALRVGGCPVRTTATRRQLAIDDLPWPAWDLLPLRAYLDHGAHGGVHRGRSIPVLTSRGCPYQCTFCSAPEMWTTRYVRRDPELVVDEIEDYVERYGVTNVDVNDLTALLTKEWIVDFCCAIVARGLRITWQLPSGTRSEAVDREVADQLHAAGCRNFCYAPESGSARTLARIKKRVQLPRLLESLEASVAAGLSTQASIIIGFPHESGADLWQTYRLCLTLARKGLHDLSVLVFAPYPGSQEYRELRARGRIEFDEAYLYASLLRSAGGLRSYHPTLGPRSLLLIQLGFLASFYTGQYALRPRRLARVVRNFLRGQQETVMDLFLSTKALQLRQATG